MPEEDQLLPSIAEAASKLLRARQDFMDALLQRISTDPAQRRMEDAIEVLSRLVARYEVLNLKPR